MWVRKDAKRQARPRWLAALGLSSMIRFDMSLLSTEEAATYLHLNVKRVQALARLGKLPGRRVGRKWLFDPRDLEAALGHTPRDGGGGLDLSARNQLHGRVLSLTVDGLMAEVRIGIGEQELVAVITRSSAERLKLKVGEPVFAVVKSTEVMIAKGSRTP
jgi:molybdopterin-binding protein